MLTFSVNGIKGNEEYILRVQNAITNNIMYFKKFNGPNWEEAVQKAFITAVSNQNDNYDDVEPYIKNLARNILKTQEVEKAYDTITEDGEVSYPYLKLVHNIYYHLNLILVVHIFLHIHMNIYMGQDSHLCLIQESSYSCFLHSQGVFLCLSICMFCY